MRLPILAPTIKYSRQLSESSLYLYQGCPTNLVVWPQREEKRTERARRQVVRGQPERLDNYFPTWVILWW